MVDHSDMQVNSVILVMTVVSMVRGRLQAGADQGIKTRELVKWAKRMLLIMDTVCVFVNHA